MCGCWVHRLLRDDELHDKVNRVLARLEEMETHMAQILDGLRAEVAEMSGVVDSVVVLIDGLIAKLGDAATMEEVQAIVTDLETQKAKLAAAVAANPA